VDLQLYMRVIWRFRLLVLAGIVLAFVLAFLSFAKVSLAGGSPKITYRKPLTYSSRATVFVTQTGFPWGRVYFPSQPTKAPGVFTTPYADAGRFAGLAVFYAQFVTTDTIRTLMARGGPINGYIYAEPLVDLTTENSLPMFQVVGVSKNKGDSITLANRGARTIREYVENQQRAAGIPPKQRVMLQITGVARDAIVLTKRKKTIPVAVFLTVLVATIGLAFVLENLRPRIRKVEAPAEQPAAADTRLTA
jgi:hypothetical protein